MSSHSFLRLSAVSTQLEDNPMSSTTQVANQLPWNPNNTKFPSQKELPNIPGAPDGAAWVWGKNDEVGRLNLLTPQRVKASTAEIETGEMVRLDLPLNVPEKPAFGREVFQHSIKTLLEGVVYDDTYSMNTQSGTQWDGFRHFAHIDSKCFYNGAKGSDFVGETANNRCSIHHLAIHGIAGRGILLDYRHYAKTHNIAYDPYTTHSITMSELQACAASQGLDLRPESESGDVRIGDILLIRSGFVERYYEMSPEQRYAAGAAPHEDLCFAGLSREPALRDWLHDCYFAAVAGDSPTFEAWPVPEHETFLHESLLPLWGVPIGEMWDLEKLAQKCRARAKWTFFMTSSPANMPGGVGTHANATAIL